MDRITQFVVGATRNEEFYSARFSAQKYFYANGVPVPRGTKLHHHTNPAPGDNFFMTQHSMSGTGPDKAVNVFTLQGLKTGVPGNSRIDRVVPVDRRGMNTVNGMREVNTRNASRNRRTNTTNTRRVNRRVRRNTGGY